MTNRSLLLLPPLALGALLAACASDSGGTTGALDQSQSRADCAPNDTACQADGLDAPVAVGARVPLDVKVTARGVAAPKIALEAARDDILGVERGELVGKAPGWSSVMMMTEDGLVLDFVTMAVEMPERLELYRLAEGGGVEPSPLPERIQLAPGDDVELTIKPWSGATRLLGELDATWTVSGDPGVATILDGGRRGSRRLRVKAPGAITLSAESLSLTKSITIEVLP